MRIKDQCPADSCVVSPQILMTEVYSFTDIPIKLSVQDNTKTNQQTVDYTLVDTKSMASITKSKRVKKKDQQGLKRLIKQQKVKQLVNRFIEKIRLNNIYSQPVTYEPYQVKQRQSLYNMKGIQLPDVFQKILSIFIAIYIMICLFIDTTASLYPEILKYPIILIGQYTALLIFLIQFISSCIVVKMIQGKKVQKISSIITNYLSDGLLIDFAYLVILVTSFFTNVGNLRLIILLKVPQCFQRLQRIQNTYINTFYKEQYWGLTKVFLLNFILSHFLSLLLVLMASIQPTNSWLVKMKIQNTSWYQQYIWGYYWGTTIMLTVGFGDIAPANCQQAICVVLIETFSCLALAYNINCVGNLISNIKSQDIQKNRNIKTFKILSNRNNLSQDLELKIHNYIQESTNIKKKFNFQQQHKFISTLPNQLKADFLKQSNKKIFQNLIFLKNLTQKTLLALSQVIQMKICHPQQIIKKRGQLSGIIILKQGKIGYCTKLNGSRFSNLTIDKVKVQQEGDPYLLSLDFISQQRCIYEIKSEQYSILYYLGLDETLQTLKNGELDYEHFCFLRDRQRTFINQYQVFKCQYCKTYHTKFECPKLHYVPLKKHIIDKQIHESRSSKNPRSQKKQKIQRKKKKFQVFKLLNNNLKILQLRDQNNSRYTTWRHNNKDLALTFTNLANYGISLKREEIKEEVNPRNRTLYSVIPNMNQIKKMTTEQLLLGKQVKKVQHQFLIQLLKDEISQAMVRNNDVWLVQCDQVKNFKFYFSAYNASTLSYLKKNNESKSLFS